jgi:SAM-dependent methyltransferase
MKTRAERQRERQAKKSSDWSELLGTLRETRAPFDGCAKKIVESVLREHVPSEGTLIEVGAGTGQLGHWLSESERARFIHTDPDAAALAELCREFPAAEMRRSSVEDLPFDAGTIAAAVGLCVLDMAKDLERAMRELHRVLSPGGRLIHLLDMEPSLGAELAAVSASGALALPNLFGDPLEGQWPLDLLVTEKAPMQRLLEALRRENHPLPEVFGRYFAIAMAEPFDAERAHQEFSVISRAPKMRELLKAMLHSAYAIGYRLRLEPPRGTLVSSGKRLSERLERAAASVGFEVVTNDVVTTWRHQPAREPEIRCRSLALGQGRRSEAPEPRLCRDAPMPPSGSELVELGMLVFVARVRS